MIERFFLSRGAPALHEISPFAGTAALKLLCIRKYQPVEVSSVLYRSIERITSEPPNRIQTRIVVSEELALWTEVNAKGWSHEHPELLDFLQQIGTISSARRKPAAAAVSCIHEGVALFVTGAARGIGRAIALTLANAGANIVALDIAHSLPFLAISAG